MSDNGNLLLAMVLSMLILMTFEYYRVAQLPPPEESVAAEQAVPAPNSDAPPIPQSQNLTRQIKKETNADIINAPRLTIQTPSLTGSLSLRGAYLDDMTLNDYRVSLDEDSAHVRLLTPVHEAHSYVLRYGWLSTAGIKTPDKNSLWTADKETLTPDNPVTLSWDNGEGLVFEQIWRMDDTYMIYVSQKVRNKSGQAVALYPYGVLARTGLPEGTRFYLFHEGAVGYLDGELVEMSYDAWQDEEQDIAFDSKGGWLGITDKYWLTAFIPVQQQNIRARFIHHSTDDKFQADFIGEGVRLEDGEETEYDSRVFVGAKSFDVLKNYELNEHVPQFELALDFGWFYFLTQPLLRALIWLKAWLGNMGLAILAITVVFRLLMYPLADKSFRAMNAMRAFQPEFLKLRERYGDDRMKLNQEMMALYKKHNLNPAAGCVPILLQLPIFFALYKVLFVSIEMRHAPFYGWITDLSAPDPTNIMTLFGLLPWHPPSFLHIGFWPLLMGVSIYVQQKLNPAPTDPIQARIFAFLPIVFTFVLASFPAGLVIYWTWNNILSMLQQYILMRKNPIAVRQAS